jgi:two-component system chemotaxis response regulator CheB
MTIHVLVVDDSAVVRQMMTGILGTAADMRVTTASDPLIAMQKMKSARPDVIVLDLEMPRMDGLTFLRSLRGNDAVPVVVCSGRAGDAAIEALEEGALEVIAKPSHGLADFLAEQRATILHSIRAAAMANRNAAAAVATPADAPVVANGDALVSNRLIALGASTGGTEALRVVLTALPAAAPPIAIVQHMPSPFTRAFAARLDQMSAIEVREAKDGDRLLPGTALLAPGNSHMSVQRTGSGYVARLSRTAPVGRHRPSVDVLFDSVARAAGTGAVAVLLTGMGSDGADGMLAIRRAGGSTIAQDEASSIVFGMPKEAIARGGAERVLPLDRIATALRNLDR